MINIEALLTAAIERANKRSPGLLGWSDLRFELDKLRNEKVHEIVRSLFAGASLEQINEAYEVVLKKEHEARQPPESQSSTATVTRVPGAPLYDEGGNIIGYHALEAAKAFKTRKGPGKKSGNKA